MGSKKPFQGVFSCHQYDFHRYDRVTFGDVEGYDKPMVVHLQLIASGL